MVPPPQGSSSGPRTPKTPSTLPRSFLTLTVVHLTTLQPHAQTNTHTNKHTRVCSAVCCPASQVAQAHVVLPSLDAFVAGTFQVLLACFEECVTNGEEPKVARTLALPPNAQHRFPYNLLHNYSMAIQNYGRPALRAVQSPLSAQRLVVLSRWLNSATLRERNNPTPCSRRGNNPTQIELRRQVWQRPINRRPETCQQRPNHPPSHDA